MKSLQDRLALVTGASRGIGQQIALGLAQRGCHLILHGREEGHLFKTTSLLETSGVRTYTVAGDLATPEGVDAVIAAVRQIPVSVDILYNNAAIQNAWREIWDLTPQDWHAALQVNVLAPIALCNAFAPEMKKRGYGRIINLSSGIRGIPQLAPYSVSKAAIDKYTVDLAAELQGTNVLVNGLDPGWLRTDMGGPNGQFAAEDVLPGALVPALLDDNGTTGHIYSAQDYRGATDV